MDITGGTFQISDNRDGQILYSGNIHSGRFSNGSGGGGLILNTEVNHVPNGTSTCASTGGSLTIDTPSSTSNVNAINIGVPGQGVDSFGTFRGAVDPSQGRDATTQSSSSMTGTTQDGDGDGILDANDNCPNLTHTSCYKEGDTAVVVHSNR